MLREHAADIKGIIHCSGGAQTKVLKFAENVKIIKDQLFSPPPLFQLIRDTTHTPYREMYKVFNMGHRMELYIDPEAADSIVQIAQDFDVEAQVIGQVEAASKTELELVDPDGNVISYTA
jgi:phosphoribosylformylglycinamidine cyclo-ligase